MDRVINIEFKSEAIWKRNLVEDAWLEFVKNG